MISSIDTHHPLTEGSTWNLYLAEISENKFQIIMPEEDGTFVEPPAIKSGYSLKWFVNPHNTGVSGIIELLKCIDNRFTNVSFIH